VIEIMAGASRGIRVLDSRPSARHGRLMELPVIGRVAAGSPMLAEAHLTGRYQIDPNLFTPRADYLLRVRGMSMRDAGILEGDLLAVHRTHEARSGQIVVARLADEVDRSSATGAAATACSCFPRIRTSSRSRSTCGADALAIEGIGVGVIRSPKSL
jgi:repressor LexA